jgi:protein-disulfide isomerase
MNGQVRPEEPMQAAPAHRSNRKWIALAIGGGCALLAIGVLITALMLAFFFPAIGRTRSIPSPVPGAISAATEASPDPQALGSTLGDPNAPVKIVEYADFQCPYCRYYWQETEPLVIETYVKTGKVYYEYRSVGAFLGQESQAAAEAAYCAGDQGRFWQYHDMLFSHWTGENAGDFTGEKLQQYAASIGLDQVAFEKCLTSGKQADRVLQDLANAKRAGIKATPSFLINGTLLEGAQPFDAFQQAIDEALQGK